MPLDQTAIDDLVELLAEAGRNEVMPRFRTLDAGSIRRKTSRADLVTEGDEAAERMITDALRKRYPHAHIVGEEAVSADPSVLEGLGEAELAFVIDPIDGSFNFASGLSLFAIMLAVVEKGETVAGIIHDPVNGDQAVAERGGGAFMTDGNGHSRRLAVAEPVELAQMAGVVSWQYFEEPERSRIAANHTKVLSPLNYKCAGHEYRLLVQGRADFAAYSKTMPWDHLAGLLIHAEAGGYSAKLDGTPYRAGDKAGGLLAAPDRESWQMIRHAIWED
ncbi:inositol monophosphatase family protein [Pararhizobium mangrovi]|uniref:Inositol monophosphatase n=1 Tax=Pararhizobium mangrovi TaxID=2590452 RepID=A0A506TXK8_9HYPH|nr:inositol monophosphatase family protein [Pararhizobium mangrovi]TPW26792.1 inositol monophosphatase [Pararhizobium mangrovi]